MRLALRAKRAPFSSARVRNRSQQASFARVSSSAGTSTTMSYAFVIASSAPASTKQYALILDDPDAQFGGQNFVHWVVYKIPAAAKGLPAEGALKATLAYNPQR